MTRLLLTLTSSAMALIIIALVADLCCAQDAALPENLARKATVTADSEYSGQYLAKFVADGIVPQSQGRDDLGRAWAVRGDTHRGGASITFTWPQPVRVAEIVYYGRTAWIMEECWRTVEVYLDDAAQPAARGQFEVKHGPQRLAVGPSEVRRVTLKFTASHGGLNPGASEIQIFPESPSDKALAAYMRTQGSAVFEESESLAADIAAGRLGFDKLLLIKRHAMNPSHVYTRHCEGFRAGGGLYTLSPPRPDGQLVELLASPDGQIMDLDLSWDSREVIFSWRRNEREGYHIFRMNVDGSGLIQLTDGAWHDYYACWLPDGGIAFVSSRVPRSPLCFMTASGVLHRMDRDGGNVRRLSANYVDDFSPSVLPDGRILFTRWEYVDRPAIPIQSLWAMRPDGSKLEVFFGNRVLSPASFMEAVAVPGTPAVLCTLTAHNGPVRGGVGLIDPTRGLNSQEAIVNLSPEVNIGHVGRGDGNNVRGPYETPNPVSGSRYLVSSNGRVMLGEIGGGLATALQPKDGMGFYDATPVHPRVRPPVLTSIETAVGPAMADDEPAGEATLYLADVYRGLEPHVARGRVAGIRVVEETPKRLRTEALGFGFQRPVISCGATYAVKKVWGTAPVEADGSAYFKVPAGRALYFIAVDSRGVGVQRMRSFTQLAAGEVQGCIGCHEPRDSVPAVTQPTMALRKGPAALEPPSWGVTGFDYARHVQPVIDSNCAKCHTGIDPSGGVDLAADRTDWFNVSYDVLTRKYVSWIDTRNGREANILEIQPLAWGSPQSRLAEVLLAGHPDKDGRPRIALEADARDRILAWIDLNVPYYGTYEMADESRPGGRRICPPDLDKTLAEVWPRRCASCHKGEKPRTDFVRIQSPEMNAFLAAPLAKRAGGRGSCGEAVFVSAADPDYQAILRTFVPATKSLDERPRMDMGGAVPDANVSRSRI